MEESGTSVARPPAALVDFSVPGPPHSQKPWVSRVIDAALGEPRVPIPCELEVEFVLAPGHVPWIRPSETCLESMLRALLEALEDTVLRRAGDEGGGLVAIHARTRVAEGGQPPGTHIVIRGARVPS